MKKPLSVAAAALCGCSFAPPASAPGYVLPSYVLTNNYSGQVVVHGSIVSLGGFQALGNVFIGGRQVGVGMIVSDGVTNYVYTANPIP